MTGQQPSRGRGRPRDPQTDTAILRAALDLFIAGGVEGTSIEQIAQRAGVGKPTVYRRWSSKEDLLASAIETIRDQFPAPPAADTTNLSVAELIRLVLPAAAETLAEDRFRALVARIFGASTSHPALMETYWQHYVLPRRQATWALLERAEREGVLAAGTDYDVLIDMLVGAVLYRAIQPVPLDTTEAHRYLEAVYRHAGLLPPHHT